eukprot:COSAG01_NODE_446_length_16939_cov_19.753518_15_plen_280_part_00
MMLHRLSACARTAHAVCVASGGANSAVVAKKAAMAATVVTGATVVASAKLLQFARPSWVAECAGATPALLSDVQTADVTAVILETYQVPLVPAALQALIVQQAVAAVAERLVETHPGAAESKFAQHFNTAMENGLTSGLLDSMVVDLNGVLDLPLLDEAQEEKLLRTILSTMLSDSRHVHIISAQAGHDNAVQTCRAHTQWVGSLTPSTHPGRLVCCPVRSIQRQVASAAMSHGTHGLRSLLDHGGGSRAAVCACCAPSRAHAAPGPGRYMHACVPLTS